MRAPQPPCRRRRRRPEQRGFVLLGVILVVAVIVATVTLSLEQSTSVLRQASGMRSAEMVSSALNHGLDAALGKLQRTDPASLIEAPAGQWDLFDPAAPGAEWVLDEDWAAVNGTRQFPATGPYAGEIDVLVGMRMGQLTQAPPGEDARSGYGYVVELQVSARAAGFGREAEERVAVGVQVPHTRSYAK